MRKNILSILERMAKTFVEGFLSGLVIENLYGVPSEGVKKAFLFVLLGGIAAGISAVWNATIMLIKSKLNKAIPEESTEGVESDGNNSVECG